MADDLTIVARLQDEATKEIRALGQRIRELERNVDSMNRKADEGAKRTGASFATLAARVRTVAPAILGVTSALAAFGIARRALSSGVNDAIEFGNAMSEVSTIVDTSTVSMGRLSKEVLDLAVAQGQNEAIVSRGLYQAISSGADAATQATVDLRQASQLAVAGLANVNATVDLLSSALNAYGRENLDAARASDVFFRTVERGKTTIPELAGAVGRVLPVASALDVEIEELSAALAALTLGGISTEESVVGLRQVFISLLNPTTQAQKIIEEYGLQVSAADVRSKGLLAVLQDLTAQVGDNDEALNTLFGNVRALVPILALTGEQADEFVDILEDLEGAAGATGTAFEKRVLAPSFQVQSALNALRIGFAEIGSDIVTTLAGPIDSAEDFAETMERLRRTARTLRPPVFALAAGFGLVGTTVAAVNVPLQGFLSLVDVTVNAVGEFVLGIGDLGDALERAETRSSDAVAVLVDLATITKDLSLGVVDLAAASDQSASALDRLSKSGSASVSQFEKELARARERIEELIAPVDPEVTKQIEEIEERIRDLERGIEIQFRPTTDPNTAPAVIDRLRKEIEREAAKLQDLRLGVQVNVDTERSRDQVTALAEEIVSLRELVTRQDAVVPLLGEIDAFEEALRRVRAAADEVVAATEAEAQTVNGLEDTADRQERFSRRIATARDEERLAIERLLLLFPNLVLANERLDRSQREAAESIGLFAGEGQKIVEVLNAQGQTVKRVVDESFKLRTAQEGLDEILGSLNLSVEEEIALQNREIDRLAETIAGRTDAATATKEQREALAAYIETLRVQAEEEIRSKDAAEALKKAREALREETDKAAISDAKFADSIRESFDAIGQGGTFRLFDQTGTKEAEDFLERVLDLLGQVTKAEGDAREKSLRGVLNLDEELLRILDAQAKAGEDILRDTLQRTEAGKLLVEFQQRFLEGQEQSLTPLERRTRELERQLELGRSQFEQLEDVVELLRDAGADEGLVGGLSKFLEDASAEFEGLAEKIEETTDQVRDFIGTSEGVGKGIRIGLIGAQAEFERIEEIASRLTFDIAVDSADSLATAIRDVALGFADADDAFRAFAVQFISDIALMTTRLLTFRLVGAALQSVTGVQNAGLLFAQKGAIPPGKLAGVDERGMVLPAGRQRFVVETNEVPGLREAVLPLSSEGPPSVVGTFPGGRQADVRLGRASDGRLGVDLSSLPPGLFPVERSRSARTGTGAEATTGPSQSEIAAGNPVSRPLDPEAVGRSAARDRSAAGSGSLLPPDVLIQGLLAPLARDLTPGVLPEGVRFVRVQERQREAILGPPDGHGAGVVRGFSEGREVALPLGRRGGFAGIDLDRLEGFRRGGLLDGGDLAPAAPPPPREPASSAQASAPAASETGAMVFNVTIQAVDADSFVGLLASNPQAVATSVISAAEEHPSVRARLKLRGKF